MHHQTINNTRHGTRNHGTREIYTIPHGITGTNFDRNTIFCPQLHQLKTKWDDKTVNIRTGNIFQMASRCNSCLQTLSYYIQIMLHCLSTCHFHLIENVIIRTADQNTGLADTDFLYQLEILLAGTNPCRTFRKLIATLHTFVQCFSVLFTVYKKLTLTNQAIRSAKAMQIIINGYNLLRCVRCTGLLSVTEGSIRNPNLLRKTMWYNSVIECNLWNLIIRKQVTEHIWLLHIHQLVNFFFQREQIIVRIDINFTILHICILPF